MPISKLTHQYISYLKKIGQVSKIDENEYPPIWAKECRKLINGNSLYQEGSSFLKQLKEVKEAAGKWSIDLKETIIGDDSNMSAIRYDIKSEKLGSFQVCAFLTFNTQQQLSEINEIISKIH